MSNKKIHIFSLGISLIVAPVYGSASDTFINSPAFVFTDIDAKAVFDSLPFDVRYSAAQTPEKVRQVLVEAFQRALLAKAFEQTGLDPVNIARARNARDTELVRIALEHKQLELRAKLPDFTQQAQELYQAHLDEYISQERIEVGHILLSVKSCADRESQRAKISEIQNRLRAGESFEDLARQLSDDKNSAAKGGKLGLKTRGAFIPAFEQAAFALQQPGQISEIVESEAGFHLIKLYERRPAAQIPFEKVKSMIIEQLEKEYINREINAWRQSLWDANTPQFNEQAIENFAQKLNASFPDPARPLSAKPAE